MIPADTTTLCGAPVNRKVCGVPDASAVARGAAGGAACASLALRTPLIASVPTMPSVVGRTRLFIRVSVDRVTRLVPRASCRIGTEQVMFVREPSE